MAGERYFIESDDVETLGFDWGRVSITVSPKAGGALAFSAGIIVLRERAGTLSITHWVSSGLAIGPP